MAYYLPWLSNGGGVGTLNFAWNANAGGDNVTNYKLYYGSVSGFYTEVVSMGNVTSYSFSNPGGTNYYVITAENANGESIFSDEIAR
jgi:hypothetical protein